MLPLLSLLTVFMKIGSITFGGGYGVLPIMQKEIIDKRQWITPAELIDFYALGQCTPGIIAINMATLVGYKKGGVAGALAATLGFVLPSFLIIILIASLLREIAHLDLVIHAFTGIRLAVCALILHTVFMLRKTAVTDTFGLLVFTVFFIAAAVFPMSPILIVLAAVFLGLILKKGAPDKLSEPAADDMKKSAENKVKEEKEKTDEEKEKTEGAAPEGQDGD